jgi:hypothetical protein
MLVIEDLTTQQSSTELFDTLHIYEGLCQGILSVRIARNELCQVLGEVLGELNPLRRVQREVRTVTRLCMSAGPGLRGRKYFQVRAQ